MIKRFFKRLYQRLKELVKSVLNNAESLIVLSVATIGTAYILTNSIFYAISLPVIIESELFIFFIAGTLIIGITKLIELRANYNLYL